MLTRPLASAWLTKHFGAVGWSPHCLARAGGERRPGLNELRMIKFDLSVLHQAIKAQGGDKALTLAVATKLT